MDELCNCICLLCDDVVIEGLDDSQLMVEWVVEVKTQLLVGVGIVPVSLNFHPHIVLT